MRYALRQATPQDLRWLAYHADAVLSPEAVGLAAYDSRGHAKGVVAFDGYGTERLVHQAATPIAVRALAPACFRYAFQTLGLSRLVGAVCGNNRKSLRLAQRLGFRVTQRQEDGFGKGFEKVWLELRREDCRWL